MSDLWLVALAVALFLAYVLVKVVHYMRKSREQWKSVDKAKLKEWKDDDEW